MQHDTSMLERCVPPGLWHAGPAISRAARDVGGRYPLRVPLGCDKDHRAFVSFIAYGSLPRSARYSAFRYCLAGICARCKSIAQGGKGAYLLPLLTMSSP